MTTPGEGYDGNVAFAIGTGRCGTMFFAQVADFEPAVTACHERNPYNETFHRYCQWYGLGVDHEGFLYQKKQEINQDLLNHSFSLESSAYLSLSVLELYERFGAKFLCLVRSPERVVNSFLYKGWYREPTILGNPNIAPSYQQNESFHHFLARFVPTGEQFHYWNNMSRIGKISWYWNAMNDRILKQFQKLPETHWCIEKIEDLDYERYLNLAQHLGFEVTITKANYDSIATMRPNKFSGTSTIESWNEKEILEFESQVEPMATKLGYEYRVFELPVPRFSSEAREQEPFLKRFFKSLTG